MWLPSARCCPRRCVQVGKNRTAEACLLLTLPRAKYQKQRGLLIAEVLATASLGPRLLVRASKRSSPTSPRAMPSAGQRLFSWACHRPAIAPGLRLAEAFCAWRAALALPGLCCC